MVNGPCNGESNSQSILDWINTLPGNTPRARYIQGQEEIMERMRGLEQGSKELTRFRQILSHLGLFLCIDAQPLIGDLFKSESVPTALAA